MINTKNIPKKTSLPQRIFFILFGLFLTIGILEIGLRIGGFVILSMQEHRNLESIKQKGSFLIMCLGESTTQNQYPHYLEEVLNQRNIGIKFSVIDKGVGGISTLYIVDHFLDNLNRYNPDIVITMMGINNGGDHIPSGYFCVSKNVFFLKNFRIYKLAKLFWLHVITKAREIKIHNVGMFALITNAASNVKKYCTNKTDAFQSEESPNRVLKIDKANDNAYLEIGLMHESRGEYIKAEKYLNKAIEANPKNDNAYVGLGMCCRDKGKLAEAEKYLNKAIEANPKNDNAYLEIGLLYENQGKYALSEEYLKKAIELNIRNQRAYVELGCIYQYHGKFSQAEACFKKGLELNPHYEIAYRGLALLYEVGSKVTLEPDYFKEEIMLRSKYNYDPVVAYHYQKLKRILDKRKIRLVCVQYPMRNIMPLKKIFIEQTEDNIIFVDNEKIFKDAVRKESYKEYFVDMFGGDFGHCTSKGNRLLAENIANAILKEAFNKK